jgi:hypothetical protein
VIKDLLSTQVEVVSMSNYPNYKDHVCCKLEVMYNVYFHCSIITNALGLLKHESSCRPWT